MPEQWDSPCLLPASAVTPVPLLFTRLGTTALLLHLPSTVSCCPSFPSIHPSLDPLLPLPIPISPFRPQA